LSVASALERCGVAAERIQLFCSHAPDSSPLLAPAAAERFRRYCCRAPAPEQPIAGASDFSAGAWRAHDYAHPSEWPASWIQRERVKRYYAGAGELEKFEGLPPYGAPIAARAELLADAGFAPPVIGYEGGFVCYAYLLGRPARVSDLNP